MILCPILPQQGLIFRLNLPFEANVPIQKDIYIRYTYQDTRYGRSWFPVIKGTLVNKPTVSIIYHKDFNNFALVLFCHALTLR